MKRLITPVRPGIPGLTPAGARLRHRPATRGAALLAFLLLALLTHADPIHKWVDAEGRVHFGDRPPENARSTVVTVRPNVYTAPTVERLSPQVPTSNAVVLYSASWCAYCRKAREYFRAKGIAFSEYDVETTAKGRDDYARLGARGVPVILVGSNRLNGFSPEAFDPLYASLGR